MFSQPTEKPLIHTHNLFLVADSVNLIKMTSLSTASLSMKKIKYLGCQRRFFLPESRTSKADIQLVWVQLWIHGVCEMCFYDLKFLLNA